MDGVFVFHLILPFLNNLLKYSYSQSTPWPDCCFHTEVSTISGPVSPATPSSHGVRKVWILDLNTTFFISSILVEIETNDDESVSVDIGTTSCGTFQDTACFVTCSTRKVVSKHGLYVTINVTCSDTNVKGRYVRVRQSKASDLALCNLRVMGRPGMSTELKNYARDANCWGSSSLPSTYNERRAVDGKRDCLVARKSCSRSKSDSRMTHWCKVDLGKLRLVSHIIITDAQDSSVYGRLSNFTIDIQRFSGKNYKQCLYFDGTAEALVNLTCTMSMWGRYVRISKTGLCLTLCEVEVYSDKDENSQGFLPVVDIASNVSCHSFIKSELDAAALQTPEDNQNGTEEQEPSQVTDYCTTCNCHFPVPKSQESVQQEVKETVKELKVQTSEMSKQVRKKSSIPDQRLSSQAVGMICIFTISSIFAVIVACDAYRLLHYLLHRRDKHLKK